MFRRAKQLVVTTYHPWRKWVVLAVLVMSLPLGGWELFDYGRSRAGFDSEAAAQKRHELQNDIDSLRDNNESLSQQLANLERGREIDQQAYAEVKSSLESMQNEISELKEEVAFYRGIAAPQQAAQGVRIQHLQIGGNGGARGYSYKLVLVQTVKDAQITRGLVTLKVQGLLDQAQKEYSFGASAGEGAKGKFQFKYFGQTEGDIVLPVNFVPTRVVVHVTVESPKRSEVEQVFAWRDVLT